MDEFFEIWKGAQEIMIEQPGAIDNVLNRTIDDDSPFQFINVAHWESPESLANALKVSSESKKRDGSGVADDFERLGVRMSQNNYVEVVRHS